nr:Chain A, GLN-ASP-VAL-ASN-THR-ALA-VAL-ALA-TRP [Homo sapiens]
QDVNTAVAW